MSKEAYLGRSPSHFHLNPVVKAFILSETFLWSAFHFIFPIFAIFAATRPGGDVSIAATGFSAYYATRVVIELISGKYLEKASTRKKFEATIIGISLVSLAYIGLGLTNSILPLFIFFCLIAVGLGIATPAKNSLFATHLDKNKESFEWSIYDAITFGGMALAAALGGFIAKEYGFQTLFFSAAFVNIFSVMPYLLYMHKRREE